MTTIDFHPRDDLPTVLPATVAEHIASGPVEIVLHAGRYPCATPITLAPGSLGSAAHPVTIRAAGDGEVVITGSRRLTTPVDPDGIARFDLGDIDPQTIRHTYRDGSRLTPARYPKHDPGNPYFGGFLYADEPPNGEPATRDRFWCRDTGLLASELLIGADVDLFPRHAYRNSHSRIVAVDRTTGEIHLDPPAVYEIDPGDRFYVQELPDRLDDPDEWAIGADDRLWLRTTETAGISVTIDIPVSPHVIHLNGASEPIPRLTVNDWPFWDDTLRTLPMPETVENGYVSFEGLTIEGSTGTAVRIEAVRAGTLIASTIRNAGERGVEIVAGADCAAIDCDIFDVGWDGVLVAGGIRKPFNVISASSGHRIENCYIHHIGFQEKHVAGIAIAGVGNTLAHCLIHDCPRWGILLRGNDHVVEYCHVRHVNVETADTSGINVCDRDLTIMGSTIRYNRVHDILGYEKVPGGWRFPSYSFGIYLDDWTSHMTVHGNLTYNTPRGGIYLNSGQGNTVTNNCCFAGRRELAYYNRWPADLERHRLGTYDQGLRRNIAERNIYAGQGETGVLYAFGRNLSDAHEVDIATNRWNRNIIWNDGEPLVVRAMNGRDTRDYSLDEWRAMGQDTESIVADPGFVDAANGDFHLKPDSPALALGFEPLPLDGMGIRPSPRRAHWPPAEVDGVRETMARELAAVGNAS